MQDFRKLDIYNKAIRYCASIYEFSRCLPRDEQYGLASQIKRAASSVPLNISEGAGASSNKEFAVFIGYSYRSCNEVLACLELIRKLDLSRNDELIDRLSDEGSQLSRMVYAFFKKLGGKTFY